MDPEKAVSLGKCVDNTIQCTGEDGKVRWIQPGGSFMDTPYEVSEDTQAGVLVENGVTYYVEYGRESMSIADGQDRQEILYKNLAGSYGAGDSAEDAALEKKYEEDLPQIESVYGNDYYTEDQVLHGQIRLDQALAGRLAEKGDQGISALADEDSAQGFLLTSSDKGLVYYAPKSGKSAVLEEGTWFRTWKLGDKYVSIGFLKGEAFYSSSDQAFARVYEYDLSELCNVGMKKSLEEILAREEQEAVKEAQKQEEESRREGESDPLELWKEKEEEGKRGAFSGCLPTSWQVTRSGACRYRLGGE